MNFVDQEAQTDPILPPPPVVRTEIVVEYIELPAPPPETVVEYIEIPGPPVVEYIELPAPDPIVLPAPPPVVRTVRVAPANVYIPRYGNRYHLTEYCCNSNRMTGYKQCQNCR